MNNNRTGGFGSFSLFPPVLKSLLIINVAVFFIQHFMLSVITLSGVSLDMLFVKYFALWPIDLSNIFSFSENSFYPWQLVSYQFLHANFWHIFMNLFALWMFGSELENLWGSKKFLYIYLLSGIGAAIVHMIITPMLGGDIRPTVGASGAVYGILLAFGMTFPNRPIFMFPLFIPIPAKYFILIFAGLELFSGISGNDGVAHFAHLGGAFTAFLLLKFGSRLPFLNNSNNNYNDVFSGTYANRDNYEGSQKKTFHSPFKVNWSITTKQEKPVNQNSSVFFTKTYIVEGEVVPQSVIDLILDKITLSGFQSLTEKEKKILTEVSKQI